MLEHGTSPLQHGARFGNVKIDFFQQNSQYSSLLLSNFEVTFPLVGENPIDQCYCIVEYTKGGTCEISRKSSWGRGEKHEIPPPQKPQHRL